MQTISLDDATRVLDAARRQAESMGLAMNIAVVDAGGRLSAFARMDGAWLGSIDIAQKKAFTARAFDLSTRELATLAGPGQPLYGIANTNDGDVVIFAGGVLLKRADAVIGAVGASGGQPDQDHDVACAGAAALR
jgi:uncharacterized protein GlcG (DUF336 family)